jgi:hypothetical protein
VNQYSSSLNISRNNIATPRKATDTGADTSKMGGYTIVDERRNMLGRIISQQTKLDQLMAKPETNATDKQQMAEAKARLQRVEAKFITHLASLDQAPLSLRKENVDSDSPQAINAQQLMGRVETQKAKLDALLTSPTTTEKEKLDLNVAKTRLTTAGDKFKLNQGFLLDEKKV